MNICVVTVTFNRIDKLKTLFVFLIDLFPDTIIVVE